MIPQWLMEMLIHMFKHGIPWEHAITVGCAIAMAITAIREAE